MKNGNQKSLKINAILNIVKSLMGFLFPLITFPYSSRVIGPVGIGKVNFAASIISYFSIIASLGISTYAIREAAKVRDDKTALSKFSKEIFTINAITTLIAYVLFFTALFCIPKFNEYRILLCISSSTILFTTIGMDWLYNALEEYAYITIRSIAFQIASIVLLYALVHTPEDYIIYGGITVFASVGSNILNFIHSKRYITFSNIHTLALKKHLKPIFLFFGMSVAIKIYTALDTTMLGLFTNDEQVGFYTAATKLNKIVLSVVTAIGAVMLPRLSYYIANRNKEDFTKLVYKGFDVLFLIAVPCTIGLLLVSKPATLVLSGKQYLPAIPVMQIMNPIVLIIGLSNYIGIQIFMPLGKEKWTLYSVLAGAITNFAANFILIPKYQAFGAAVSTVIAEAMVTFIQIILLRKYVSLRIVFVSFFKSFANSTVMAIPVAFCVIFIHNIYIGFVSGILAGIATYLVLLLIERNVILIEFIKKCKNSIIITRKNDV